jgi:branched-chain amino acid transport system ATP-binding protein
VLTRKPKQTETAGAELAASELRSSGIAVHFEGVKAVDGVDLTLRRGELLGLIGPNGAGKTTLVNALTGYERPTTGQVFLGELDVTGWVPHKLGPLGMARTFQAVRLFSDLTALENVEMGALGVGMPRKEARKQAWELLDRMGIADKAHQLASALPYGDERKLGFLRALSTNPLFLLLDEPAAGMNEVESDELMLAIGEIRDDFGCGILVIEHDMRLIFRLCERIHVIDYGKTIAQGTPMEIQTNAAVIEAYLGKKAKRSTNGSDDAGD